MVQQKAIAIQDTLNKQKLLFDGAFGTYYAHLYDTKELPEFANRTHPERVRKIHKDYIEAGAGMIRTNTFASNTVSFDLPWETVQDNLRQGYRLAQEVAKPHNVYVAADIGQIPYDNLTEHELLSEEYVNICRTFLEEGADIFVFETFSDLEDIRNAIDFIGKQAFVIVQFSVNQFGYSHSGLSARKLVQHAEAIEWVDAVGFNCGIGPGHLQKIIRGAAPSGKKWLTALPNAGYPQIINKRMFFSHQNIDYFAQKVSAIATEGADIVGGCCGTTPDYIRSMKQALSFAQPPKQRSELSPEKAPLTIQGGSFFAGKADKKLIAVELAPPLGSDDEKLMDAAHLLIESGVDVLTFPDSPSGRTRADSILVAEKVARETGISVMPHICCRDKNAIAIRSQLLGAHINHISNFLVITGDPIPSLMRNSIRSVFHFDSVGLMHIMNDMNEEEFSKAPICFGGAINQNRKNLALEIGRVQKKMNAGATFFMTQPVSCKENAERVRQIKQTTGARILCGIMPFVSLKNALFMKNEMTGIEVPDEVLARYRADMTKEEGEQAGIEFAKDMIALTKDFADGYYFSFPFNRVGMLKKIMEKSK